MVSRDIDRQFPEGYCQLCGIKLNNTIATSYYYSGIYCSSCVTYTTTECANVAPLLKRDKAEYRKGGLKVNSWERKGF